MLKISFRNQVLIGFAVSIILVLVIGILSYSSITKFREDTAWVDHTQKVIKTSSDVLQLMVDAETGMRGYGATEKPVFLDPYFAAIPKIHTDVNQLKQLIQDNPIQVRRVDSMSTLVELQLHILKTDVETRPVKGLDYMVQNNMFLNGKQNMDQIRALNDHLIKTEGSLLTIRKASSQQASTSAIVIIVTGSLIFLVIIIVLFFFIQGTFEQQKKLKRKYGLAMLSWQRYWPKMKQKTGC